jgi:hypothetical protein
MIVKVASDTRQGLQHWNIYSLQLLFVSNAGLHQQLRCVDRTKRENYFARGYTANSLFSVADLDACCVAAIE